MTEAVNTRVAGTWGLSRVVEEPGAAKGGWGLLWEPWLAARLLFGGMPKLLALRLSVG